MRRFLSLLTVSFLAVGAAAQTTAPTITFTGVLQRANVNCLPAVTHVIECTSPVPDGPGGVRVGSNSIDLSTVEGVLAHFTATPVSTAPCPAFNVSSVQIPPPATLISCGTAIPGCTVRFRVGPTGVIGQWVLFYSFHNAFVPTTPTLGTVFLGLPLFFFGGGSTTGGPGSFHDAMIPPDASLTGTRVWVQGARRDVGPIGPWQLTNVLCFIIGPPSPPCQLPNC